jgi:dephospho-CoA kinase
MALDAWTRPVLKVALTGGIATGKSYVLARLQGRGIPCLDADELAHGVMAAGTEASAAIAARFGPQVLDPTGAVDRTRLGPIVFADPDARRDLERIVHPAVYRAITAGLRAFDAIDSAPLAVADIPLLYETGHAADFDKVIATVCPPEMQVQRLMLRGLGDKEARQRLSAQMSAIDKGARADFMIRTDGSFEETNGQVDQILRLLLR